MLGADGVLVTSDVGGNDFVEVALSVQACIQAGMKTVFMSTEESSEEGQKPPWLYPIPEVDAVVSLGSGGGGFGRRGLATGGRAGDRRACAVHERRRARRLAGAGDGGGGRRRLGRRSVGDRPPELFRLLT